MMSRRKYAMTITA